MTVFGSLGPKWHSLRSLPFQGPKKSRFQGPPFKRPSLWISSHPNPYVPPHIDNKTTLIVIRSFLFIIDRMQWAEKTLSRYCPFNILVYAEVATGPCTVPYLHGFSIDASREAHDCDQGVHHAEGEETVLQDPAHYSHQLERDVLFYIDHILYGTEFNLATTWS